MAWWQATCFILFTLYSSIRWHGSKQHVLSHSHFIPASDDIVVNNMFYLIHPLFQHQITWWQATCSFTFYSSIRWHGGKQHVHSHFIPASDDIVVNNMFYIIHPLFQHQMTWWQTTTAVLIRGLLLVWCWLGLLSDWGNLYSTSIFTDNLLLLLLNTSATTSL